MNNITIDSETNERVFHFRCDCGTKGGEVRFRSDDPRSDDELEAACRTTYKHICDVCCCKDGVCKKHEKPDNEKLP